MSMTIARMGGDAARSAVRPIVVILPSADVPEVSFALGLALGAAAGRSADRVEALRTIAQTVSAELDVPAAAWVKTGTGSAMRLVDVRGLDAQTTRGSCPSMGPVTWRAGIAPSPSRSRGCWSPSPGCRRRSSTSLWVRGLRGSLPRVGAVRLQLADLLATLPEPAEVVDARLLTRDEPRAD